MPVNILVADDSVTMRRIMELTFAGEDAQVTTVDSGQACVERARETVPDVVFCDASMGGIDGYGVAAAIKSSDGLDRTAVILMASQKHPYDDNKGRASGVDDHVLKPFDTQHVIDRVNQVLSRPRAKASVPGPQLPLAAAPSTPVPSGLPMAAKPAPSAPTMAQAPSRPAAAASMQAVAPTASRMAVPSAPAAAVAAATSNGSSLHSKLHELGLDAAQVSGVLALSREVIEQVVWEVVPDLAETLIKEEIRRLTAD